MQGCLALIIRLIDSSACLKQSANNGPTTRLGKEDADMPLRQTQGLLAASIPFIKISACFKQCANNVRMTAVSRPMQG